MKTAALFIQSASQTIRRGTASFIYCRGQCSTAKMKNNNKYIISKNGVILPWEKVYTDYLLGNDSSSSSQSDYHDEPMDASALLQRLPRGAYTTCRTVKNGRYIYQLDYHVNRLVVSSASILESILKHGDQPTESDSSNGQNNSVSQGMSVIHEKCGKESILNYIRLTLDEFRSLYSCDTQNSTDNDNSTDPEFRITLLAAWEATNKGHDFFNSALYCHIGLLNVNNYSSSRTIRVLIHGHGRQNASTKDSKWVTDRKKLIPSDGYEEIILINDKHELLEGTQTNFYVVKDDINTIITANEGVLFGSVRDSVLQVCKKHNIHVELRPPSLNDLKSASGVFLSSTSRWVMPVHQVHLGDLSFVKKDVLRNAAEADSSIYYYYDDCPTTDKIRRWVMEDVERQSTSIF